jgi:hypothetical protein
MGAQASLRGIKLRLTPRRAAVQYLEWMHKSASGPGKSPLHILLKQMRTEIETRYRQKLDVARSYDEAERALFHLINIYCNAVCALFDELVGLVQLTSFAEPFCNLEQVPCQELAEELTDKCNRVALTYAIVQEIETASLRAPVLPKYLREVTEIQLSMAKSALELSTDPSNQKDGLIPPAECADWGRANLPQFASFFWSEHGGFDAISERLRFIEAESRLMRAIETQARLGKLWLDRKMRALGLPPLTTKTQATQPTIQEFTSTHQRTPSNADVTSKE